MAARPIWNGLISFGMVSIPVGLYTAVSEKDVSFNQLHRECGSRIKQQKFCPTCDRLVETGEIEKGYEYSKGHYVILEPKDFEELPVPSKQVITITSFIDANEVDPTYFDTAYYLEPDDKGVKPFALLVRALQERGLCAIAKVAIRSKESLCLIRLDGDTVVLETLYYPDEIKRPGDLKLDEVKIDDRELQMALSLVDYLRGEFKPEEYQDEYRIKMMEMIDAKIKGEEVTVAPVPQATQVVDLMEALRASLEQAQAKKAG
jgi:DNA end-binding protein Ku